MSHVASPPALDLQRIRQDFPILRTLVRGKPLVYLDNAATSQKPIQVLNAVDEFFREANSNVHRGVHFLSPTRRRPGSRSRSRPATWPPAA